MTSGDLANAPLIVTDIPTAHPFINQSPDVNSNGSNAGQPVNTYAGDLNRRYYMYGYPCVMMAMDNVPNSFGKDSTQKGIIGVTTSYGYDGSVGMRTVIHQPTGSVRNFTTGWDVIPGAEIVIPNSGANVSYATAAAVCSQRQGEFAYVFMYYYRSGIFTDSVSTTVYKVTRDEYIQIVGVSGGNQILDGWNTDATLPIIQVQNGGQFFVSDEEEPFVWNVSGTVENGGTAQMCGFRDDNSSDLGSYYTRYNGNTGQSQYNYSGQTSAYFQTFKLPDNVHGFGPYLVHPWESGNYAPPEMWVFVQEFDQTGFHNTGRFLIYRSRWKKGMYQQPANVTLEDDPDFEAGKTKYPKLNPLGYGWETDIINSAHLVSVVGPFGVPVYNPKNNILATIQNQASSKIGSPLAAPAGYNGTYGTSQYNPYNIAQPFGFTVLRDKKRQGVLHLVAVDGGSYPANSGYLNRVWFSNSNDDGKTWSPIKQMSPAIQPSTQGTLYINGAATVSKTGQPTNTGLQRADSVSYRSWGSQTINMPSLVRTHDDVLLMGNVGVSTTYTFANGAQPPYYALPPDAGQHVALAVIDYTGTGSGIYNKNAVVFVQRATRGSVAWQ